MIHRMCNIKARDEVSADSLLKKMLAIRDMDVDEVVWRPH